MIPISEGYKAREINMIILIRVECSVPKERRLENVYCRAIYSIFHWGQWESQKYCVISQTEFWYLLFWIVIITKCIFFKILCIYVCVCIHKKVYIYSWTLESCVGYGCRPTTQSKIPVKLYCRTSISVVPHLRIQSTMNCVVL